MITRILSSISNPWLLRLTALAAILMLPVIYVVSVVVAFALTIKDFSKDVYYVARYSVPDTAIDLFDIVKSGEFDG